MWEELLVPFTLGVTFPFHVCATHREHCLGGTCARIRSVEHPADAAEALVSWNTGTEKKATHSHMLLSLWEDILFVL